MNFLSEEDFRLHETHPWSRTLDCLGMVWDPRYEEWCHLWQSIGDKVIVVGYCIEEERD